MKGDITLIVLTYNEEMHIQRCIESAKALEARVIVVDSFSVDNKHVFNISTPIRPSPPDLISSFNLLMSRSSVNSLLNALLCALFFISLFICNAGIKSIAKKV